jgi:hypothetical protein
MKEKRICGNLQLIIDQHVRHLDSERVPRIHLLYDVHELLRHVADPIAPAGTQQIAHVESNHDDISK